MSKKNNEMAPPPPSTAPEGLISRVAKAIVGPKACKVKLYSGASKAHDLYLTESGQAGFEYEGKTFKFEKDAKDAFAEYAARSASQGNPEFVFVDE